MYITGVACWLDFKESLGFGIRLPNLQKFYFPLIDTVHTFILILSMKAQELLVRIIYDYTIHVIVHAMKVVSCMPNKCLSRLFPKNMIIGFISRILGFMMPSSLNILTSKSVWFFKPQAGMTPNFLLARCENLRTNNC